jgi:hypothetical protein
VVGATPVEADDIKNGNVTISSTTDPPVTPVPGAPGCENPNWTEDINDVAFTSATIRLFQDQTPANGEFGRWETLVLTVNCTFNPPTSNSEVPSSGFTCTFRPGASERLLPLPPTWTLFGRWEPHAPLAQGVTDRDPAPYGRAVELPLTSHAAQLALEPT